MSSSIQDLIKTNLLISGITALEGAIEITRTQSGQYRSSIEGYLNEQIEKCSNLRKLLQEPQKTEEDWDNIQYEYETIGNSLDEHLPEDFEEDWMYIITETTKQIPDVF